MQRLKRTLSSIYSDEEQRVLGPGQRIRQRLLAPIALLLSRLGISPNMLSYASVFFGMCFFLLAPFQYPLAFWMLVMSVICDGLDGVEARVTGKSTPRGSFTDAFCDQAVVAFSVAGLAWRGTVHPVLAILFVYVYTGLVTFFILHQMLQVSSRWLVRPSRLLLYVAIALDFFFHINWLNYLLLFYLFGLPMLALSFWRLRRAL